MNQPDFIKAIRMYRSERGLSLQEARDMAVMEFIKRGWTIPDYELHRAYKDNLIVKEKSKC